MWNRNVPDEKRGVLGFADVWRFTALEAGLTNAFSKKVENHNAH